MERKHSVVVIGGGIIGISIAVTLLADGTDVLLVEKDQIGTGASFGNAGHIATEQVFPVADPSILKSIPGMLFDPLGALRLDWRYLLPLTPWLLRLLGNMRHKPFTRIHHALSAINGISLEAWQSFSEQWQLTDLVKIQGSLLVAEKAPSLEKLRKHGEYLNSIGVNNQLLTQSQLLEREPALAHNQLGGLFYPDTGHVVDLKQLHTKLVDHFLRLGGELVTECEVTAIKAPSNDKVVLTTSQGQIVAKQIVIAGGAFSKSLVNMISRIRVPLETERGYHLMLPNEIGRLNVPVSSIDRRFIMTPMNRGLRLAGTVEYAGLKRAANMQRARYFLPLANPMLNEPLNNHQSTEWMGFRPTLADSLPVIDKKGPYIFAFGHQHLGLTQAAVTAKIVQRLFQGQSTPIDCSPYSIERFI